MSVQDCHKIYGAYQRFWSYYSEAYYSTPDQWYRYDKLTGRRYITQFRLEAQDDYYERVRKAVPVDVCSTGIDLMVGSITDIKADIPEAFQEFWEDADLQDTDMVQLMMEARTKAAIFGHCFLLVDSTKASGEVMTEMDVQMQGIRPFVRILTPLDVTNWRLDQNGCLVEAMYKCCPEPASSILDSNSDCPEEYRYWSDTEWRVYQGETIVESGPNPLGCVPLVALYHRKIQPMLGDSLIRQASRYQQLLTNWISAIDNVQEKQSFAQAVLTSEEGPKEVGVGSNIVLHLRPETKSGNDTKGAEKFEYVAPDVTPLELSWNSFYRVQALAVNSMALPGDVMEDKSGKSSESGVAKAYRWKNTDKRLLVMSLNEQEAVRQVLRVAGMWMGMEFDGSVQYPTTFDLSSIDESIQNLLSLQAAGVPQTAKIELMKSALQKALPRLDKDTWEKIEGELEASVELQAQKAGLDMAMQGQLPEAVGKLPPPDPAAAMDKISTT